MINIFQVIDLAHRFHYGAFRKGLIGGNQVPYIQHPFDVSRKLLDWGISDPIIQSASFLHDSIEEAKAKERSSVERQILAIAGVEVLNLIKELTHVKDKDKVEYMKSFATKSIEALVIKIADRLCNVKDFNQFDRKYARKYYHKADVLFEAFRNREDEVIDKFGWVVSIEIDYTIRQADCWVK